MFTLLYVFLFSTNICCLSLRSSGHVLVYFLSYKSNKAFPMLCHSFIKSNRLATSLLDQIGAEFPPVPNNAAKGADALANQSGIRVLARIQPIGGIGRKYTLLIRGAAKRTVLAVGLEVRLDVILFHHKVEGQFLSVGKTISGGAEARISHICLLYTSPSPRDRQKSRMPSSA